MKNSRFPGVVFLTLILIAAAFPLSGPDDDRRAVQPAGQQIVPPMDSVPPNLDPAEISEEEKALTGLVQYPGNSYESLYRGVVAANVNSGNARDEVIVDFGTSGVWVHDGILYGGTWHQISGVNPNWIFSVRWGDTADEEIIGDFGSLGLWEWNHSGYPGVWTQLSGVNPDQGLAVDDDGDGKEEIQIDFGTLGLWRYDADTAAWKQYSALNPILGGIRKDMWTTGNQEGTWSFTGYGVWSFHSSVASANSYVWQLSGTDPSYPNVSADFGAGVDPEELIMNFGSTLGTWLCQGASYPAVSHGTRSQHIICLELQGSVLSEMRTTNCWWISPIMLASGCGIITASRATGNS